MIIFEDDYLLVVNKPAGLLTIPDGYDKTLPNIANELTKAFGRIWVVHRLDKDTSGALVFAKNEQIHSNLNQQFSQRLVNKIYHGIILGDPEWNRVTIMLPLLVNGDRKHRTVVSEENGKPAKTIVAIMERFGSACFVDVQILTGYTHQIRAHLNAVGFPILSDKLYNRTKNVVIRDMSHPPINRLALHAYSLNLKHPVTREKIQFLASYPDDFDNAVRLLRKGYK